MNAPTASLAALQALPVAAPARVLATGAWLKNTACRVDGAHLRWSSLHGDLGEPGSCLALEQSLRALRAAGPLDAIAHDLHPDFHSTRLAGELAQALGVPAIAVQHHHAHVAAVQAEHGHTGAVVGLALDGVGLGTDGGAWGGELLWVHGAQWRRLGHLAPLRLPGGDVAAREPWRLAAGVLHALGRGDEIERRFATPHAGAGPRLLHAMLERGVNCPPTSSAGRWFDAAAGLLGLCPRQAFEAQAAIALEQAAGQWLQRHALRAEPDLAPIGADGVLDLLPLARRLLELADAQADAGQGAALFHLTLADGLARWAIGAARQNGLDTVALGGGCFFNQLLSQQLVAALQDAGLRVLRARQVNSGDAGLALGQAWVAAHTAVATHAARPRTEQELLPCA